MKVPTDHEEKKYISSLSRGLWAPNSWLVSIAEIAELPSKSTQKQANCHHYLWTKLSMMSKPLLGQNYCGAI